MFTTHQKIIIAQYLSLGLRSTRGLFGLGPELRARRDDILWQLDLREGIDLAIFLKRYERQELNTVRRLVRSGFTAIDIGANVGFHTLLMAQQVGPQGRVIAIEPTDFASAKLKQNLALNPELQSRVTQYQFLLAASPTSSLPQPTHSSWPLTATRDGLHPGHWGRPMSTDNARQETLDNVLQLVPGRQIDFIKLDVDGNEVGVLQGGRQLLSQYQPTIMLEFAPHLFDERSNKFQDLLDVLADAGYEVHSLDDDSVLPLNDAAVRKVCRDGGGINVVALAAPHRTSIRK